MKQKKTVMIADNSPEFCAGLIKEIEKHDAFTFVGSANDGEQAASAIRQLQPDILVLDLLLRKKDGIMILKELGCKKNQPLVIATSSFINDYMASSAASLGVRYLMLKPCDMSALVERLEELAR